jgi:hypothetical protein
MSLHVCGGPRCVTAQVADDRLTRFCFRCRKHLRHYWEMVEDGPERQPSSYDPVPVLRCTGCGKDCADFPGTYRDGPRYPCGQVWQTLTRQASETRMGWDWDAIWARDRAITASFNSPTPGSSASSQETDASLPQKP